MSVFRSVSKCVLPSVHRASSVPAALMGGGISPSISVNVDAISLGALSSWGSFSQGTAGARPTSTASVFGSQKGVVFDGGDFLSSSGLTYGTTAGSFVAVFKTPSAVSARQCIYSVSDTAVANEWFEIGIDSDRRIYIEYNNAGTIQTIKGSTFLEISTAYVVAVCYDGTDWYVEVDGVEENPLTSDSVGTFAWMGAIDGTQVSTIGACTTSGGTSRYFSGSLAEIQIYNGDLTE